MANSMLFSGKLAIQQNMVCWKVSEPLISLFNLPFSFEYLRHKLWRPLPGAQVHGKFN